jgi:hypothetical protein
MNWTADTESSAQPTEVLIATSASLICVAGYCPLDRTTSSAYGGGGRVTLAREVKGVKVGTKHSQHTVRVPYDGLTSDIGWVSCIFEPVKIAATARSLVSGLSIARKDRHLSTRFTPVDTASADT